MRQIEIITVRLSNPKYEPDVKKLFLDLGVEQGIKKNEAVRPVLFRCSSISTDWSIHLCCKNQETLSGKTLNGRALAEVLSAFGLVSHSVWEQI